jgi:hypothetical protein
MTRRKRSGVEEVRSDLYKAQRAIGDGQALHRGAGHYVKRVVRRKAVRSLFRLFR